MQPYANIGDVDAQAELESAVYWIELSEEDKNRIVFLATRDIENFHGMARNSNEVWKLGDIDLNYAGIEQSLYLARVLEMRDLKERVNAATNDSYSDGIVNFSPGGKDLTDTAKALVGKVMSNSGIMQGTYFKRG